MNDERRLGQDRTGEDEHRVGDDEVDDVGQDVDAHDVAAAGADDPRAVDERALLQRQRLRPDDPGRRRPARDADDDDDDEQLSRMPKSSLDPPPTMSRMIGARMIASTNVGRTRKKSVIRMRTASVRPPTKPDDDADERPRRRR